jgi:hypothetical protein
MEQSVLHISTLILEEMEEDSSCVEKEKLGGGEKTEQSIGVFLRFLNRIWLQL